MWSTTATTAAITVSTAGTYDVTVTDGNGCTATASRTLNVSPVPVSQTINPSVASGSTVCLNQTISATFSGGSGGVGTVTDEYEYSTNSGGSWSAYTPGDLIPTPTVGTDIIRIRTRRTATGNGCTTSSYNTAQWSVANQPSVPALASSVPASPTAGICQGTTVSAVITPGSGGDPAAYDEYEYSINDGTTWLAYTSGNNINTASATGSVQIRVRRVSSGSGCTSTSWSNVTNWPVSPTTVGGTVTGGTTPLCVNTNIGTLNLSGQTGSVVRWEQQQDGGGWDPITNTTTSYTTTPSSEGQWEYRAVVQSGVCPEAASAARTIDVAAQPDAAIIGLPSPGTCSGASVSGTAVLIGGSGTSSYFWSESTDGGVTYTQVSTNLIYNAGQLFNNSNTQDKQIYYRFTHINNGVGCNTRERFRNFTVYAPPSLIPTRDQCASTITMPGGWDYVYLTTTSIHKPVTVTDYTTGNENNVAFSADDTFKIYRIPMNTTNHLFQVEDEKGCIVQSNGINANPALPVDLPKVNSTGVDVSSCYVRELNDWAHFRPSGNSAEVIASIQDNGIDLGRVIVTSYKDAQARNINPTNKACPGDRQAVMRRHFTIESDKYPQGAQFDNNGNVLVRFYFDNSDFANLSDSSLANDVVISPATTCTGNDNITNIQQLYVTKYTGSNEDNDWDNNDFTSGVFKVFYKANSTLDIQDGGFNATFGTSGKPYNYVQLSVTEFSEFWLHGGSFGDALPVEMLYIEAKNINNSYINVQWATASELNNWKFEVERSEDGVNFSKIGEVLGNGTTTDRHDYVYSDKTALQGIRYYYRLKQIDFDESYEYSPIVSEMLKGEDLFTVSEYIPNPATDQAKLFIKTGKEQEISIEMHNYVGAVVKEGKTYLNKGSNTINVDFNDLAAGTYTTRIVAGNTVVIRRVVIAR